MSNGEKDTYKYQVKRNGKIIGRGWTYDLKRRASDIKADFPDAKVQQVGRKTTREDAEKWLGGKEKGGGRLDENHN